MRQMGEAIMIEDITKEVTDIVIECVGDDMFLEDDNYEELDLYDEYDLDIYFLVELVTALRERLGLDITPTQVERNDINTLSKIIELVEDNIA